MNVNAMDLMVLYKYRVHPAYTTKNIFKNQKRVYLLPKHILPIYWMLF